MKYCFIIIIRLKQFLMRLLHNREWSAVKDQLYNPLSNLHLVVHSVVRIFHRQEHMKVYMSILITKDGN